MVEKDVGLFSVPACLPSSANIYFFSLLTTLSQAVTYTNDSSVFQCGKLAAVKKKSWLMESAPLNDTDSNCPPHCQWRHARHDGSSRHSVQGPTYWCSLCLNLMMWQNLGPAAWELKCSIVVKTALSALRKITIKQKKWPDYFLIKFLF